MIYIILAIIIIVGVYFAFFHKKKQPIEQPVEPPIKPPEIPKVSQELQDTGFMLSSLSVFEGLWCNRITKDTWKQLLDDFATKGVGNWSRSFLFPASPWQYKYKNWLIPVFKKKNGLYQLPMPWNADDTIGDYVNPDFIENVLWVIKEKTAREIGEMISLWDNCGFHTGVPWNNNFLNPENNTIGKHLSNHRHAYHLYADKPDDEQMQNTGLVVEALTRYMLQRIHDELTPAQRQHITIEACNEGNAGYQWHERICDIIIQDLKLTLPPGGVHTSTSSDELYYISSMFSPIKHHIGTLEKLREVGDMYEGVSTDGHREPDPTGKYTRIPIPGARMAQILEKAYGHGFYYLETLNGHRQEETRLPGGKYNTTANKHWYDFSAMRWGEMKKVANKLLEISNNTE